MSLQSFRELNIKHIFLTDEIWNFSTKENVQESKGDFFFGRKGNKNRKEEDNREKKNNSAKSVKYFWQPICYITEAAQMTF